MKYFTLIELMVVLFIMTIIIAMVGGIVNMQSRSTDACVVKHTRMIGLSRQYAIAANRRVALLLPEPGEITVAMGSVMDTVDATAMNGKGLRPAVVDVNNTFVCWVKDTNWTLIPERTERSLVLSSNPSVDDGFTHIRIGGGIVHGIVFRGNGSLTGVANPEILITPTNQEQKKCYRVTVDWLSGQTKTKEYER